MGPRGVIAAELTRELGPFYVEVETHGVEAITMQTSGTLVQQDKGTIGGALTKADGFQAMGSGSVVIADHFGMSLTESLAVRR